MAKPRKIGEQDPLFDKACERVRAVGFGSASDLQRKFHIGYPHAASIKDELLAAGELSPLKDSLKRHFLAGARPQQAENTQAGGIAPLLKALKKNPQDFTALCDTLKAPPSQVKELLEQARTAGYPVRQFDSGQLFYDPAPTVTPQETMPIKPAKNHFIFGATADWHIGSKVALKDELLDWIESVYALGVRDILVAGDPFDGIDVYRGHRAELKLWGVDEQRDYLCKLLPRKRGLSYKMIGGNHDESFLKAGAGDIIESLAERRDDVEALGFYEAWVPMHGITAMLHLGDGGGAYALSYKLQRFIDAIPGGQKPQILIQGHYHNAFWMPYRNVFAFHPGCFQGPTLFTKRKGLHPVPGGYVIEVWTDEDRGIRRVRPEFLPYYFGQRTVVDMGGMTPK